MHFKFRMPGTSILLAAFFALMIVTSTEVFDALRYMQCTKWTPAVTMPYSAFTPSHARDWVRSQVLDGKSVNLIRGGFPTRITYYAVMENGNILSCSTDMKTELEGILNSWAITLILLPIGLGIWSGVVLMKMFIENGQPTLWDWSGRGTQVK